MKTTICFIFVSMLIGYGCDSSVNQNESDNFNYEYSIEQKMESYCQQCGYFVKLYVNADTVSKAVTLSDNVELAYKDYRHFKSIKELEELIATTDTNKHRVIVEYSSDKKFPSYLYIEPKPIKINDSTTVIIADAEYSYTTRNYEELD